MNDQARPRPLREANRITKMLDKVFGEDRFEQAPVDMALLALEYSKQINPEGPIHEVVERNIPGCMGALVYSENLPRQWGILYHVNQSPGRRSFTVAHEFGHFVLHRALVEKAGSYDGGIYCDENSVLRGNGEGIEKEADKFAAAILMPLNDYRKQIPSNIRPDLNRIGKMADRYGVSLTAAILRWLEYTDTRAIMVVSNEGYAHWSKPSKQAFRSGRFIRTKNTMYELPPQATAIRREFTEEALGGIEHPAGVWFPEPVVEMCLRSDRYDQEITLLHMENDRSVFQPDEEVKDSYDWISPHR